MATIAHKFSKVGYHKLLLCNSVQCRMQWQYLMSVLIANKFLLYVFAHDMQIFLQTEAVVICFCRLILQ